MRQHKPAIMAWCLGALLLTIGILGLAATAEATVVSISTGNTDPAKGLVRGQADPSVTWNYTGDFNGTRFVSYVGNDPAFGGTTSVLTCHMVGGNCRINNNSLYGGDVTAGYPAYLGVQFFYLTFDLPSNAQNVVMNVTTVGADDRVGFHLNGNEIGYWGNVRFATIPSDVQLGRMDGSDRYAAPIGPGVEPTRASGVPFHDPFIQPDFALTDPGLFTVGATNVARLWVNNTGTRNNSASVNPLSSGNPSVLAFEATISYDLAVPEPPTLAIFGLGLAGLGFMRRRRKLN